MRNVMKILIWTASAVIAALLILTAITYVNLGAGPNPHAMQDAAKASLKAISQSISLFKQDRGRFPNSAEIPDILTNNAQHLMLVDSWGKPFRYRVVDGRPIVDSAGPDREFDTQDDIQK